MASDPISAAKSISGNQPAIRRIIEGASETFLEGVPVMVAVADGGVEEWNGTTIDHGIAGISKEPASNLTATGVAEPLTYGSVPNQASAVNIPRGAPLNDGRVGFELAVPDTVFRGQVGPAQTTAVTDVGVEYGMTKDTDDHWYVDKTKTTVGTDTVVRIVGIDTEFDTTRGVLFVFLEGAAQVIG